MPRFIQETNTEATKPTDAKPIPKFGGKDGKRDYSELANTKKIISPQGGRR